MPVLLRCDGLSIHGTRIPRFEIGNEYVILEGSTPYNWKDMRDLVDVLSGNQAHPSIHMMARTPVLVCPWLETPGWWERRKSVEKVARRRGLSGADLSEILEKLKRQPRERFYNIGLTERVLFGLMAARAKGADLVVCSPSGVDPSGYRRIASFANAAKATCGVLQVGGTFTSGIGPSSYCNADRVLSLTVNHRGSSNEA